MKIELKRISGNYYFDCENNLFEKKSDNKYYLRECEDVKFSDVSSKIVKEFSYKLFVF